MQFASAAPGRKSGYGESESGIYLRVSDAASSSKPDAVRTMD